MTARRLRVLDASILAFVLIALYVKVDGGFFTEIWDMRVSMRKFERPMGLAILLVLVRWWLAPGVGFLGVPIDRYAKVWRRIFDPAVDAGGDRRPHAAHALAACAGLVAMGTVLMWPQLTRMRSVPDLGDPLFSIWRMGWVYQQVQGDPRPLFDANIFHPLPLTLTLSDSMLLPAVTAAPFFALGVPPAITYNIMFLSGFLFSGIAVYFLAVRVTGSALAAFIAAAMYAFYPYRMEHYSHFELQMTHWMPLALMALIRFTETWRTRDAVLMALCMAAQLYSSMYYGVFFVIFAAAVFGTLLLVRSHPSWPRLLTPIAIAGTLALAISVPLARPYVQAQSLKGDRDAGIVEFYSADFADFLRAHERSATYGGRLLPADKPERALFPGATPMAFAAIGLVPPIGAIQLALTAGLAVGIDVSRGMNGFLYPTLYAYFPPIRGMRVPARMSVIAGISLVVLGGFGVRRILTRCRTARARAAVTAALVGAVMVDLRPHLELMEVWPDAPPIYRALDGVPTVVLAEFPFTQNVPMTTNELMFMYFSLWHWRPMVNGYSGFTPESHALLIEAVSGFPDATSIAALRARGVTHVTVNCTFIGDACPEYLARADDRPELVLVQTADWQGRPTRLYELRR